MGGLLDRELIKNDFESKYPVIVDMMSKELDTAKNIFDAQVALKKEKGKAALHKNMPKVSGGLRWSHELRERICHPMKDFKHIEHPYVYSHI